MTSISTVASGPRASTMLAPAGIAASGQSRLSAPPAEDALPADFTVLTLARPAADDVVYARPKAASSLPSAPLRAWAGTQRDGISAWMVRNNGASVTGALAEQWRGLGGALLSRFTTTDTSYKQALVDLPSVPGVDNPGTERADALDADALNGMKTNAATVNLTVQTRSGQTVELKIAVNPGKDDGSGRGILVELSSSSDALGSPERQALAQLADGLDAALEGLGRADQPQLDLKGLMAYDSSVLASLDLTVRNPKARQALSSFSLHLGAERNTVALTGASGEINLTLDKSTSPGPANVQQRQSAIADHLRKFDASADRGHADAGLLSLFKAAFTQLHTAPSGEASAQADASALSRQVRSLQSGLADFQASFRGDTQRTNDWGAVHEKGHAEYEVSQTSSEQPGSKTGDRAITQTQTERLDAHYLRSRFGGMLDINAGNHDVYKVQDDTTRTTRIDTAKNKVAQVSRSTDEHLSKTYEKLENNRVEAQGGKPRDRHLVERLLNQPR